MSSIICWEEAGEVRCEGEEERRARELEEKLKQHLEAKLAEMLKTLVEQYEVEITVNVAEGKGVGRWRRKQQ
jgi:phosphotransferase system HPr-like phosphotransfer protein